jgi:S1-C subfamily serine protease
MRYAVKVVALVFALAFDLVGKDAPMLLGGPASRSVVVATTDGHGTGVIVSKGFVISNFHILKAGSGVRVDGRDAVVVKVDPLHDLVLLAVETIDLPTLILTNEISQDDEIVVIGNPLGHKRMISRGRIIDITNGKIYIDAHIFLGSSGSGVYNSKGALIGIVEAIEGGDGDGFPFGVVISAGDVARFLMAK